MICDLFFVGKYKNITDLTKYDEEFVVFYLKKYFKKYEMFAKEDVENVLSNLYGNENIKNSGIYNFCTKYFKHFKINKDDFFKLNLTDKELDVFNKINEFEAEIENYKKYSKEELYTIIENELFDRKNNVYDKLKKSIVYFDYNEIEYADSNILYYHYYKILLDYFNVYRTIDYKLEKITDFFYPLEITELHLNDEQLQLMVYNNIFSIKNIKYLSIESLICLFCLDVELFINQINQYTMTKEELINDLNDKVLSAVKKEWIDIAERRYDFKEKKRVTLAEIGEQIGLTRERIRQIFNRIKEKVIDKIPNIESIFKCIFKKLKNDDENFVAVEKFVEYIDNERLSKILLSILGNKDENFIWDENYGIIYNKSEITIEQILEDETESLPNFILNSNFESFNKIEKQIIEEKFRLYQDKVWVNRKCSIRTIYMNEIKENFWQGYNISDENDYNRLLKIIYEKYGDIEVSSMHSIQAMIDRSEFIQIDRGTYRAVEYCVKLPRILISKIRKFIIDKLPIVAYAVVYEEFKYELMKFGVDNRYYLKGLIDSELPDKLVTKRDVITVEEKKNKSTYDVMKEILRAFDGEITLEELKEKMPGLKNHNYENYISMEEENGLIRMSPRTYIYYDKLNISKEDVCRLENVIDSLYDMLDSDVLTAKKIYTHLRIFEEELLKRLNITAKFADFELFSILQYIFRDKYYFNRPLMSRVEEFETTAYAIIKEYTYKLDKFTYSDLKDYIARMNFASIANYTAFMEELSDEYVQVSKDGMMKKEIFELKDEKLEKIDEVLDMILKRDEIKTENFDGYFLFPKLNKAWNKYLLVGIIRSYLDEKYEIINTTIFYDTTDFIIRRKKYGK